MLSHRINRERGGGRSFVPPFDQRQPRSNLSDASKPEHVNNNNASVNVAAGIYSSDFSKKHEIPIVPLHLKSRLAQVLNSQAAVGDDFDTEQLSDEYRKTFGEDLNPSEYFCSSLLEILSLVPELAKLKVDTKSKTKILVIPTLLCGKEKDAQETAVKTNDAGCIRNDESPDVKVNGFCNDVSSEVHNHNSDLPQHIVDPSDNEEEEGQGQDIEEIKVKVTAVRSPDKIYIINSKQEELNRINEDLKELMEMEEVKWKLSLEEIHRNKKYAAEIESKKWRRVKTLSFRNPLTASVMLIDYGTVVEIPVRSLRKLPESSRKEDSLIVAASLVGIERSSRVWSDEDVSSFKQFINDVTENFDMDLICEVGEVDKTRDTIPVWLKTPAGRNINDEAKKLLGICQDKEEDVDGHGQVTAALKDMCER